MYILHTHKCKYECVYTMIIHFIDCIYVYVHTTYILIIYVHVHTWAYVYINSWTCTYMSVPCSDTYIPFCHILSRVVGFQMNVCRNAARQAPACLASSESSEKSEKSEKSGNSWQVDASWKWEKSLFQVTLHENGCLSGWWVRIWIGAGGEPSRAEECLDLSPSQNITHLSREQSISADSLILSKSEKVPPDSWFYWWTFFCCPDETLPICCRSFLFTMQWSLLTFSISLVSFVINALLGTHAQPSPTGDTSSPKSLLNKDSIRNFCFKFVACCLHADCSPGPCQQTYPHSI